MNKINNSILSKIYMLTYVISFSAVILFQDTLWESLRLPHLLYIVGLIFGIFINIILATYLGVKYNNKELILGLICLLLSSIIPLFYGNKTLSPVLFMVILMILNAYIIHPFSFIKMDFIMRFILVICIVSMFFLHVFSSPDIVFRGSKIRYGLGFEHPNVLAFNILSIFFSYILMKSYNRKYFSNILSIFLLFVVCFIMSRITGSRELEISGYLLIIFYMLGYSLKLRRVLEYIFNVLTLPLCIIACIVAVVFTIEPNVNIPIFYWINEVSSNRLVLQAQALQLYPIKFFGYISTPLLHYGTNLINVDNFYVAVLIHCGILGFMIFEFILFRVVINSIRKGNYITNIILIIICISLITCYTNEFYAPLIYITSLVYNNNFYNYKNEGHLDA